MATNHNFTTTSTAMTGHITPHRSASSNYQVITDEPGLTQYLYSGGTIEQPVRITFRSNSIKDVGGVKVVNPPINKGGAVQYSVKLETVGRRKNPTVANAIEDEGVALWLNVKQGANDQWNADDLQALFQVLLGLLMNSDESSAGELAAGKYRFAALAKGITKM